MYIVIMRNNMASAPRSTFAPIARHRGQRGFSERRDGNLPLARVPMGRGRRSAPNYRQTAAFTSGNITSVRGGGRSRCLTMRKTANYTRNTSSRCVTARVTRAGELHSRNFSLAEYKTWGAAEAAARKWLDRIKPSLPAPISVRHRKTKRNASGIVGVQLKRSVKRGKHGRWVHYAWLAFWPEKPGGISWGIEKYGGNHAFVCAAIARRLETADRDAIERKYSRIKGTPEYRAILRQKSINK